MKVKIKSQFQKKIEFILGIILSFLGVILLFSGINQINSNNNFKRENIQIEAIVTDSNSNNKFTAVSFFIDEKEYKAIAKSYSSQIKNGDKITVFYNKENPSIICIEDVNANGGAFIGIGGVILIIGLGFAINKSNNSVNKAEIIKTGKKIQAGLEDIVYDTKTTSNGKHPYYIVCSWKNKIDGKTYKFRSDNLWYDPNPYIKKLNLERIPVYIIPSNPKQYHVAVEEITSAKNKYR